mgnify:CR=1 FL=1
MHIYHNFYIGKISILEVGRFVTAKVVSVKREALNKDHSSTHSHQKTTDCTQFIFYILNLEFMAHYACVFFISIHMLTILTMISHNTHT